MTKNPKINLQSHAAAKGQKKQAALASFGKGGKAVGDAQLAKPVDIGFLRRLFQLTRGSALTGQERIKLISEVEERIAQAGINPKNFGLENRRQMAEIFINQLEKEGTRVKTFREFVALKRIEGYGSRVRGTLLHLFVRNFPPLQKDFRDSARAQVEELNSPEVLGNRIPLILRTAPGLINAYGDPVLKPVKFGKPLKGQKIRIFKKDGTVVEYVDDMYVSHAGEADAKKMLWTFLEEIEVKAAAAAKGLGKQIGFAQLRIIANEVDYVEIVVEGFKTPQKMYPENIIFSQRSIDRNAVTLLSRSKWARLTKDERIEIEGALETRDVKKLYSLSGFRFQKTSQGQGETFRRITLAVPTDYFDKLLQAVLPGSVR
jgi:hypothetical protein